MLRASVLLVALAACVPSQAEELDMESCPEDSELTWESFGGEFLATYCQRCHASDADDRNGAPSSFTFDSADQVRELRERIFVRAAGDNTSMPPGPDDPPEEERALLAEWLACGAP